VIGNLRYRGTPFWNCRGRQSALPGNAFLELPWSAIRTIRENSLDPAAASITIASVLIESSRRRLL